MRMLERSGGLEDQGSSGSSSCSSSTTFWRCDKSITRLHGTSTETERSCGATKTLVPPHKMMRRSPRGRSSRAGPVVPKMLLQHLDWRFFMQRRRFSFSTTSCSTREKMRNQTRKEDTTTTSKEQSRGSTSTTLIIAERRGGEAPPARQQHHLLQKVCSRGPLILFRAVIGGLVVVSIGLSLLRDLLLVDTSHDRHDSFRRDVVLQELDPPGAAPLPVDDHLHDVDPAGWFLVGNTQEGHSTRTSGAAGCNLIYFALAEEVSVVERRTSEAREKKVGREQLQQRMTRVSERQKKNTRVLEEKTSALKVSQELQKSKQKQLESARQKRRERRRRRRQEARRSKRELRQMKLQKQSERQERVALEQKKVQREAKKKRRMLRNKKLGRQLARAHVENKILQGVGTEEAQRVLRRRFISLELADDEANMFLKNAVTEIEDHPADMRAAATMFAAEGLAVESMEEMGVEEEVAVEHHYDWGSGFPLHHHNLREYASHYDYGEAGAEEKEYLERAHELVHETDNYFDHCRDKCTMEGYQDHMQHYLTEHKEYGLDGKYSKPHSMQVEYENYWTAHAPEWAGDQDEVGDGTKVLEEVDADNSHTVTKEEWMQGGGPDRVFDQFDTGEEVNGKKQHDGVLKGGELEAVWKVVRDQHEDNARETAGQEHQLERLHEPDNLQEGAGPTLEEKREDLDEALSSKTNEIKTLKNTGDVDEKMEEVIGKTEGDMIAHYDNTNNDGIGDDADDRDALRAQQETAQAAAHPAGDAAERTGAAVARQTEEATPAESTGLFGVNVEQEVDEAKQVYEKDIAQSFEDHPTEVIGAFAGGGGGAALLLGAQKAKKERAEKRRKREEELASDSSSDPDLDYAMLKSAKGKKLPNKTHRPQISSPPAAPGGPKDEFAAMDHDGDGVDIGNYPDLVEMCKVKKVDDKNGDSKLSVEELREICKSVCVPHSEASRALSRQDVMEICYCCPPTVQKTFFTWFNASSPDEAEANPKAPEEQMMKTETNDQEEPSEREEQNTTPPRPVEAGEPADEAAESATTDEVALAAPRTDEAVAAPRSTEGPAAPRKNEVQPRGDKSKVSAGPAQQEKAPDEVLGPTESGAGFFEHPSEQKKAAASAAEMDTMLQFSPDRVEWLDRIGKKLRLGPHANKGAAVPDAEHASNSFLQQRNKRKVSHTRKQGRTAKKVVLSTTRRKKGKKTSKAKFSDDVLDMVKAWGEHVMDEHMTNISHEHTEQLAKLINDCTEESHCTPEKVTDHFAAEATKMEHPIPADDSYTHYFIEHFYYDNPGDDPIGNLWDEMKPEGSDDNFITKEEWQQQGGLAADFNKYAGEDGDGMSRAELTSLVADVVTPETEHARDYGEDIAQTLQEKLDNMDDGDKRKEAYQQALDQVKQAVEDCYSPDCRTDDLVDDITKALRVDEQDIDVEEELNQEPYGRWWLFDSFEDTTPEDQATAPGDGAVKQVWADINTEEGRDNAISKAEWLHAGGLASEFDRYSGQDDQLSMKEFDKVIGDVYLGEPAPQQEDETASKEEMAKQIEELQAQLQDKKDDVAELQNQVENEKDKAEELEKKLQHEELEDKLAQENDGPEDGDRQLRKVDVKGKDFINFGQEQPEGAEEPDGADVEEEAQEGEKVDEGRPKTAGADVEEKVPGAETGEEGRSKTAGADVEEKAPGAETVPPSTSAPRVVAPPEDSDLLKDLIHKSPLKDTPMEDAAAPALGLAATGALGVGSFAAGKKGMDAIYRHLDEKDEKEYQEKKKAKAARKKARAEKRAQIQAMLAEQEEKHEGAGADAAATTRPETYPPAGEEVATPVDEQQAEVGGGSSRAINSTPARLPATENEEQAVGRGAEGAGTRASVSDTGDAGLAATTRELQSEVGSSTTAGAPPQEAERTAAGGNAGVAVTSEGSAGRKQDSAGAEAEAEEDIAAGEAAEEVAQPLADEPTPTGGPETTASGRALADETGTEAEEPSTTDRGLSGGEDEQAGQQEEDLTSSSRAAEDQEGPSTVAAAATAPGRGEPSDTLPPLFPSSTTQSAGANGGAEEAEPANTGVDITSARPEEERGGLSREQGHGRSSEQQQEGVSGPPSQVQPETVAADAQAPLQPQLPVEGTTTMAGDDTTSGSAGSAPSTFPSSTDASSVPPGGPGTISSDALIASSPYRVGVMDKHGRVMELGPYKPPYEGGSSGQNRGDTASGTVVPPATAAPSGSATAAPPNAEQPEPEDDPAVEPTSAFLQRGNTKTIDEGGPSSKVGNRAEHSSSQQEIDVSVEKTTRTAGGGVEPRFTLHEEHDNSARTTGANGMKPETTTIPPVVPFKKTNLRRRKNHSSQMHGSPLQMVMQISSSAEEVESEQPAVPPVGEEDELLPEMQHGETLRKTATSGVEQQTVLAVKKTPHFRAHRKKHLQKTGGEEGVIQSTAVVAAVDENINPGQQIGGAFETANEFSTTTTGTSLPGGNIQTATSTSDAGRSASGLRGNESRTSTTDHGEFSHQNEGKASTKMNYQPSPSFRSGSTSSFLSGATYFYGLCGAVFFVLLVGMAVYFLPCLRSWSRGKSKILGQKHVHPHAGTNNKDARTHGAAGGGGLMHA